MKKKCALIFFSLHGEKAGEMFILDDSVDSVLLMTSVYLKQKVLKLGVLKLNANNSDKTPMNELAELSLTSADFECILEQR